MTTQATPSNNALGRRSLPSSFFSPLQTIGRYMERSKNDRSGFDANADEVPVALSDGSEDVLIDPGLDDGVFVRSSSLEASEYGVACPATAPGPNAFAEVARIVWSRAAPENSSEQPPEENPEQSSVAAQSDSPFATLRSDSALPFSDRVIDRDPSNSNLLNPAPSAQGLPPGPAASAPLAPTAGFRPEREDANALAHDASNLLSALRLYSELLCFSGVLHERHRHYADDLRLLSLRSEKLIDRLVRLAGQLAETDRDRDLAQAGRNQPDRNQLDRNQLGRKHLDGNKPGGDQRAEAQPSRREATWQGAVERTRSTLLPVAPLTQSVAFDPQSSGESFRTSADPRSADPGSSDFGSVASGLERAALNRGLGVGGPETLERGPYGPEIRELDATEIESVRLADVVVRLRGLLDTLSGGALAVEIGPEAGVQIAATVDAVERVLVNLVANAAVAIRGGGAVRIRAGVAAGGGFDSTVVLTVDDSGCGMTGEQLDAALGHPSANGLREDTSSRHGRGLSIVRELVEANGGRISIQSLLGRGTRIEIYWKAKRPEQIVPAMVSMRSDFDSSHPPIPLKYHATAAPDGQASARGQASAKGTTPHEGAAA